MGNPKLGEGNDRAIGLWEVLMPSLVGPEVAGSLPSPALGARSHHPMECGGQASGELTA